MKVDSSLHDGKKILSEMLTDSSIDRVMAIDNNWNIIAFNTTCEQVSGLERNTVIGRNLLKVFPEISNDTEMISAIKDAFSGFKTFLPSAIGLFNRNYIENHFIPLRNEEDEIFGVMNIMHDVAHRIKVEKQLVTLNTELENKFEQLQKVNQDLATFTYIVGKEIQDPVRSVYTALEIIARNEGSSLSNASRGSIRKMQASLNRINLLLGDILVIARTSQFNLYDQHVDLNDVLDHVQHEMAGKIQSKSAMINVDSLPKVMGSSEMLQYMFHQLLDNAIKFQPPDQPAVITIKSELSHAVKMLKKYPSYYKISVIDNGIGFDPKDAMRIFNMFERLNTTEYKGSGVGLALCQKIMEKHEGIITAKSQPGNGAEFICYFPAIVEE
jgi:PAS domain S-box-containing protein